MGIIFNFVGEKGIKTIDTAKKHFSTLTFIIRIGIKFSTLQAIVYRKIFKWFSAWVKTRDSLVGGEPDIAIVIGQDTKNHIIFQTVGIIKRAETIEDVFATQILPKRLKAETVCL